MISLMGCSRRLLNAAADERAGRLWNRELNIRLVCIGNDSTLDLQHDGGMQIRRVDVT